VSNLDAALAPIRQRFLVRCGEDAAALRAAMAIEDYNDARLLSHRIAGLAGTIGFSDISEAATNLEEAIEGPSSPNHVRDAAAVLLALLDQAATHQPR
jgi:HPt (histidine-containing phosphotransfer) domain-containing protein